MPAKLNFKEIAETVDIFDVAKHNQLIVSKDRATCPVCETERALQFYPETNSFTCWASKVSGDCITLHAHVNRYEGQYRAAKEIAEHFLSEQIPLKENRTAPQKPIGVPSSPVASKA